MVSLTKYTLHPNKAKTKQPLPPPYTHLGRHPLPHSLPFSFLHQPTHTPTRFSPPPPFLFIKSLPFLPKTLKSCGFLVLFTVSHLLLRVSSSLRHLLRFSGEIDGVQRRWAPASYGGSKMSSGCFITSVPIPFLFCSLRVVRGGRKWFLFWVQQSTKNHV